MNEDDLKELTNLSGNVMQSLNTINMMKLAESDAISKQKNLEFATEQKRINEENSNNLSTQLKYLGEQKKAVDADIDKSLNVISFWNVNAEELTKLDDEFLNTTTEDGKNLMKENGVNYRNNFQFYQDIANNTTEQIKYDRAYLNYSNRAANELQGIVTQLTELRNEAADNLVDVAGISGVIDEDDVYAYMKEDTKGEGGTNRFYNEDGSLSAIGRAFSQPMKNVSGLDVGTWNQKQANSIKKQVVANELTEKAGAVTFAADNLKNLEDDDKLKKSNEKYHDAVGTHAVAFSGSKSDWANNSFDTNRAQKNSLNKSIIKGLKFGQAENASDKMKSYLSEFDGATPKRQEEIIYNIVNTLLPSDTDMPIGSRFGKGFKKGSGMEEIDFDQDGMFNYSSTYTPAKEHMIGMLQQWQSIDNMYPNYQKTYKNDELLDESINKLMSPEN